MNENTSAIMSNTEVEDEVNLIELTKTLWRGRSTLILFLAIGLLLGVIIAILTPNEFTAKTIMVPQMSSSSSGSAGLGGLAALAGIDLSMAKSSELSPIVYPQIVNSLPFKLELMNAPIHFKKIDHPVSLYEYYTDYKKPSLLFILKKYTIGLPGVILGALRKEPASLKPTNDSANLPLSLTKKQYLVKKILDRIVNLEVDKKEGVITLTAIMSEPLAAAELAQKAQEILQKDITKFKIEKTQADLEFIQGRYNVVKAEFESVQVTLASMNDRNRDLTSGLSQVQTDRIQSKYTIAYSVFQDLSKQLEQAKIQVKKDTPVFTIVEPVSIPTIRSKPSRVMIMFVWIFIGGIAGIGFIFGKHYYSGIKQNWSK